MDASVAAAADAAAESHTLPEKEGRARCCELISALRAQGTGEIEADPKRVQMVNGERLRKLMMADLRGERRVPCRVPLRKVLRRQGPHLPCRLHTAGI